MCSKYFDEFDDVTPAQPESGAEKVVVPQATAAVASQDALLESQVIVALYLAEITHQLHVLRIRILAQMEKSQRLLDNYAENAVEPAD